MNNGYGQYCPLSLSVELLCQRWTVLVASRLVDGCTRFNEIHRGVPQISPSLLSKRLKELEEAGIVTTRKIEGGRAKEYTLTPAGEELGPIIDLMAIWGQRWARDMELEDLDPAFLVWSMHLRLDGSVLPPGRTVAQFTFSGCPNEFDRFWLVSTDGEAEMCLKDPGHEIDLRVEADLRTFIEAWRGFRNLESEIAAGRIRLIGPRKLRETFPKWLMMSSLAPYERMRPGRERRLSRTTGPREATV